MGMTADQMAIDMILRGDRTGLARLAKRVSDAAHNRADCPDCGDVGPHDDNGMSPSHHDFSMCCRACGCHFGGES
jgi:hypothetical protein